MKIAIKEFFDSFPDYDVKIKPRPDGTLLLTMHKGETPALNKAIDSAAIFCDRSMRDLVREVQRDIKLASGEIRFHGEGSQWIRNKLPTFTGGPIHETASKTLVARRKLDSSKVRQYAQSV